MLDVLVLAGAFALSYMLRFDFRVPPEELRGGLAQLPYVVCIQLAALATTGVYHFVWRYVGMTELKTFGKAAVYSAAPILALRLGLPDSMILWQVPRSIILVDTLLAFGGVLGLRIVSRGLYERSTSQDARREPRSKKIKSLLMIGAGRAGVLAVRDMQSRGERNLAIRGFVDDDPDKRGAVIQGIKVLGTTEDLSRLVSQLEIDRVVITIAQASRRELRRVLGLCNAIGVETRIIPALHEILEGRVEISRTREVSIEDLLGRETVSLDEDKLAGFLTGKTVMVTGAGGSIGSELVRQVSRFRPRHLILVERAEFALFEIDREMRSVATDSIVPLIGDVGDEPRMRAVLSRYRPDVLVHAAAHKHVPMMEDNPSEAIKNNVVATRSLGEIAGELGVGTFVLISTDKAVRPTSVMGASKRLAELVIQDLDDRFSESRYLAVRFGNVLGSAGSVIPIFRDQVARGGPVTVTTPDMIRYFMTIPEASQLVLQAGAMGRGGEIFVLDMGQPVKILDLAKDMIRLSGLVPFEDIDIVFSGARPGEKRFEEIELTGEHLTKTRHPKIWIGKLAGYERGELRRGLAELERLSRSDREEDIHTVLNQFLPEANLKVRSPARFTNELRADSRHPA